jgi:soluble lytic murein transglycosylase
VTRSRLTGQLVLGLTAVGVLAIAFGTIHFTRPAWYERLWYPLRYGEIVRGHAHNYRLDPALLAAVIYQESKFEADARSDRGAIGLMQLLPETAQGIAARTGGSKFHVGDLYDPEINIRYGAWYLRHLLDKYRAEPVALAAYNAGQANVDSWRARGIGVQFEETRDFVKRVEKLKGIYRHAYSSLRQQKDT